MAASSASPPIEALQVLRAVAAVLVLLHHAADYAWVVSARLPDTIGFMGVQVFFVLSGFIMQYRLPRPGEGESVWRLAGQFFLKRVIRVMPMYWLATAVLVGLMIKKGLIPSTAQILSSVLLWPQWSEMHGQIAPLLLPGWTLSYEMFFYALLAVMLALRPHGAFLAVACTLCAASLFGLWRGQGMPGAWIQTWSSPLMLNFLGGMVLAKVNPWLSRWPGWGRTAWVLAPLGLAMPFLMASRLMAPSLLWQIPTSIAMVMGALAWSVRVQPSSRIAQWGFALWVKLGDASYAIYLWHGMVLNAIYKTIHAYWPFGEAWASEGALLLAIPACLAVCAGIYVRLERPLTQYLNQRLLAR